MATVSKTIRLVNPGRKRNSYRKRKRNKGMSLLQKLHFGSKAQRTAAAMKLKNPRKKRHYAKANPKRHYRRKRNVSNIVTVRRNPTRRKKATAKKRFFGLFNPKRRKRNRGKKVVVINKGGKRMAKIRNRKRRTNRSYRRRNYGTRVGRSWSTYKSSGRRKRNPGRKHYRRHHIARHRNPSMLSGTLGRVVGVLGGLALTNVAMGMVPASFGVGSGPIGYLTATVVAFAQGKLIGMVSKNAQLGQDFMIGGFAYVASHILNNFFPSLGQYTGLSGMRGMGLIGGSSFYVPQVNQNGSMGTFQVPAAVMGAIPMAPPAAPASASLGRLRRTGRMM